MGIDFHASFITASTSHVTITKHLNHIILDG